MRSLFVFGVYFAVFGIGMGVPFVLTLGHLWIDLVSPERLVYVFQSMPFSFLIAVAAIGVYLLVDRRDPPRFGAITGLTVLFALWITMSLSWSVKPVEAWEKWDWAFKGIVFAAFTPYVIRSLNQIEAFIQVYVFSLAASFVPYGAKVLISGGGYGWQLGLITDGGFLANEEILSAACLMAVALLLFLRKHSRIVPLNGFTSLGYLGLIVAALATMLGTFSRTAVVGLAVLAAILWLRSKRKMIFGAAGVAAVLIGLAVAPPAWLERMSTIGSDPQDTSAAARLEVWNWMLRYVTVDRPLGGGFEVYLIDRIFIRIPDQGVVVQTSRAAHNSIFEVLGEQGWPGFAMFSAIILITLRSQFQVMRRTRNQPQMRWSYDLALALQASLLSVLACGMFTNLAYQPLLWYLFALTFSLSEYVRRVEQGSREAFPAKLGAPALA